MNSYVLTRIDQERVQTEVEDLEIDSVETTPLVCTPWVCLMCVKAYSSLKAAALENQGAKTPTGQGTLEKVQA